MMAWHAEDHPARPGRRAARLARARRGTRGLRGLHDEHEVDARARPGGATRTTRVVSAARRRRPVPRRAPYDAVLPAISTESDCLICSTFFRRILIDAGENPDALGLDDLDELVVAFGLRLAHDPHGVDDDLHAQLAERFTDEQIVLLAEFGAIMVATNVFNDALGVPLDAQLEPYRAR